MCATVLDLQQNLLKHYTKEESAEASDSTRNIFKERILNTQATINTMFKKAAREEACQAIPFDVAKSEKFNTMFDLVS